MYLPPPNNHNPNILPTKQEFPFLVPAEKPNRPLSTAVKRNYEAYESFRQEQTELYT